MNKFKLFTILSLTLLVFGCNNAQKLATQTLALVADYNKSIDTSRKLKICTKDTGGSFACDSKDAILIEDLTLRYPGRVGGRFILEVTSGPNHVGQFIGIESADWQNIVDAANAIENATNESKLRIFFNSNFVNFGFLQDDPASSDPGHFLDKNGIIFSETEQSSKDLEALGASIENARTDKLEEILNVNYGLSADRAQTVAKNISAYQRLSSKRSLTEKEKNYFSSELLGVNFKEAYSALTTGDSEDFDDLLERAADKNGTSPEQISSILTEIFL